jgi:hypothetical protein
VNEFSKKNQYNMLETGEMGTARDSETVIFGEGIQKGGYA